MKKSTPLVTLCLALACAVPSATGADDDPAGPARTFIEKLNQACDHQARIPASVRVLGTVAKPGRYEMRSSDSIWTLLERAEIDADAAAGDQIVLIRRTKDGVEERHILNWKKRKEHEVEPLLCDGDVIYIPVARE